MNMSARYQDFQGLANRSFPEDGCYDDGKENQHKWSSDRIEVGTVR
jgi:hypothetical protein